MDKPRFERRGRVRAPGDVAPGINEISAAHDTAPSADEIAKCIQLCGFQACLIGCLLGPGFSGKDTARWRRRHPPFTCDLAQKAKEAQLARAHRSPLDWHALVAVVESFAFHAIVEKAPRGICADGRDKVVLGLVKIIMVVFVEEDWHRSISRRLPRLPHHRRDARGVFDAVTMQEKEIGSANDVFFRNNAPAVTSTDQEAPAIASSSFDTLDELMNALGLENIMVVANVAFVVDLDKDIAIASVEKPIDRIVQAAFDRFLVLETLILAEIEKPQDNDRAQLVRPVKDAFQAAHVVGTQTAVCFERGVVPGLLAGVTLGVAALQIQGHAKQTVPPPGRHGSDELACVAF